MVPDINLIHFDDGIEDPFDVDPEKSLKKEVGSRAVVVSLHPLEHLLIGILLQPQNSLHPFLLFHSSHPFASFTSDLLGVTKVYLSG